MPEREHRVIGRRFVIRKPFLRRGCYVAAIRDRESGKVVQVNSRTASESRAARFFVRWCEEAIALELGDGPSTFPRFDRAFAEWRSVRAVRPSTARDDKYSETVYKRAFGDATLAEIDRGVIERFVAELARAGRAPRTRQKHVALLRCFFRWCRARNYCRHDPTDGIKFKRSRQKHGIALDEDEARRLVAACSEPEVISFEWRDSEQTREHTPPAWLSIAVRIALHTGLRKANVLGLRWSQIDLGRDAITVSAAEMKAQADHVVPIHPELRELFIELVAAREADGGVVDPDELVVGAHVKSMRRSFARALRLADLPPCRWHDLRHTFATWLSTRSTEAVLKALLAHTPPAADVTWRYLHVSFSALSAAIEALPTLVSAPAAKADKSEQSGA